MINTGGLLSARLIASKMKMSHKIRCTECKTIHIIHTEQADYIKWKQGEYISQALPYLSMGQREMLISGICGECYDRIYDPSRSQEGIQQINSKANASI